MNLWFLVVGILGVHCGGLPGCIPGGRLATSRGRCPAPRLVRGNSFNSSRPLPGEGPLSRRSVTAAAEISRRRPPRFQAVRVSVLSRPHLFSGVRGGTRPVSCPVPGIDRIRFEFNPRCRKVRRHATSGRAAGLNDLDGRGSRPLISTKVVALAGGTTHLRQPVDAARCDSRMGHDSAVYACRCKPSDRQRPGLGRPVNAGPYRRKRPCSRRSRRDNPGRPGVRFPLSQGRGRAVRHCRRSSHLPLPPWRRTRYWPG
jgi:hypothetical protein